MRKLFALILCFCSMAVGAATIPTRTLAVRTNGVLAPSDTNFFNGNVTLMTNALNAAGFAPGGSSVSGSNGVIIAGTGLVNSVVGGTNFLSLYAAPTITSFVNDVTSAETGATITANALTWVLAGGTITSQSIAPYIGALAIATRTTNLVQSFTTNRTYTLTVTDGTTTNTASTSVTFYSKAYWGASVETSLNDAQIIALSSEFSTTRVRTKSIATTDSYIYFAYPAAWGAATFTVDGFSDEGWTLVTRAFVNASGASVSYNIYRHTLPTTGTYAVTVN
jgi:hypothetical protein